MRGRTSPSSSQSQRLVAAGAGKIEGRAALRRRPRAEAERQLRPTRGLERLERPASKRLLTSAATALRAARKPAAGHGHSLGEKRKVAALVPLLLAWFAAQARDLPWRRTRDPYAIWVSEIMLQQTQVKTVIPYWERWLRELPDVVALALADGARLHKLWEGLGYYTRVRNLQRAARQIVAQHDGKFPDRFEAVLTLPGIGRYTAGAICSIAFNQPTPIVDGNVARVLARVFGLRTEVTAKETQDKLWALATTLVGEAEAHAQRERTPVAACSHLNQSLMELGAMICTPRAPACGACPLAAWCVAQKAGKPERFPVKRARPPATARRVVAFVAERAGKYLVHQRPPGGVNAGLWEFPNVEVTSGEGAELSGKPLCTIKHSITRYRITLEAVRVPPGQLPSAVRRAGGRWCGLADLEALAFTSAHRRIVRRLAEEVAARGHAPDV